ncbi:MAG: hypothetical protein JXR34_08315 [Bacteroidales bacterium]|nr:hypothetical protein [Bacteroidales bacterium]
MKTLKLAVIALILMSAVSADSLFSIVTKKEDALVNKKYTQFIVVDDATGLCLAKTPVKYDPAKEMPVNYFTVDLPEGVVNAERLFVIHNLITENNPDNYDWVIEDNADEKKVFFSRSNFIVNKLSMQWRLIVRGERVLIKNVRTGNYLKINPDGSLHSTTSESEAGKWKLIHVF